MSVSTLFGEGISSLKGPPSLAASEKEAAEPISLVQLIGKLGNALDCDQIGRESSIKTRLGESHPNAIDYYTLLAVPTIERSRTSIPLGQEVPACRRGAPCER